MIYSEIFLVYFIPAGQRTNVIYLCLFLFFNTEICAASIMLGPIVMMYTKGAQQLNPANAMPKQTT